MKTYKIALLSLITLLAFACGNADTTSTTKAEATSLSNTTNVTNSTVSKEMDEAHNKTIKLAEEEMIAESDGSESVEKEELTENLENIENPTPQTESKKTKKANTAPVAVKVNNKVPVKEIKENIPPPTAKVIEESKTEVVNTPPAETVVEKTKEVVEEVIEEVKPPAFSHDAFDALLKKYVSSKGNVNYKGFKSSEAQLDAYLEDLKNNPPASNWSRKKTMAYYINAYNAGTIKLILKNYPVKSIMDLHGGKPWDVKWIQLGKKTYSLNNIENDILRPKYKDARIHFAVNCAAKSCPPLLNRAWTEATLNQYFEKQTKAFINDASQNTISATEVEISKIFDWYGTDFGDIVTYLNKYSNTKIATGAKVTYKEYNWGLNK